MPVFDHPDFDHHEQVAFFHHQPSGLNAIVAVHNSNLGPALGGCRMWPYSSNEQALSDVLRLSRGMTYKSAVAGLPLGGGKCVIIGDPRRDKSESMLLALGEFIQGLGGAYITAEDSGTSVPDMAVISRSTEFVAGVNPNGAHGGDPSPTTAYGTFVGLKAAVKHRLGSDNLSGLKVAIQGVGNVGFYLAKHLKEAGAELIVADIFSDHCKRAEQELGATVVAPSEIYQVDADVFSPCALGGSINSETVSQLRAKVIAGAANNQLAQPQVAEELLQAGILYTPDYVLNAGGIIDIAYQREGKPFEDMHRHVETIGDTLAEIFSRAEEQGLPTHMVADQLAEQRFIGSPALAVASENQVA